MWIQLRCYINNVWQGHGTKFLIYVNVYSLLDCQCHPWRACGFRYIFWKFNSLTGCLGALLSLPMRARHLYKLQSFSFLVCISQDQLGWLYMSTNLLTSFWDLMSTLVDNKVTFLVNLKHLDFIVSLMSQYKTYFDIS